MQLSPNSNRDMGIRGSATINCYPPLLSEIWLIEAVVILEIIIHPSQRGYGGSGVIKNGDNYFTQHNYDMGGRGRPRF